MYEDRVAKGALLLDRVRPGWAAEIAMDHLAMHTCHQCIVGQLYGSYSRGWHALLAVLPLTYFLSSVAHGFRIPDKEQQILDSTTMKRSAQLADAWRAEIRRRLAT